MNATIEKKPLFLTLVLLAFVAGCPLRPADDALEDNDTAAQATRLLLAQPLSAKAVQNDADVFALDAPPVSDGTDNRTLELDFETTGGEDCPSFEIIAPDGSTLYRDTNRFCGRVGSPPVAVSGATLEITPHVSYTLRVPATSAGIYLITITEKGQADNVFDFAWSYQIVARLTN